MTSLVTGASGFVGSAVVHALVAAGHRVRAMIRSADGTAWLHDLGCETVIADLRDEASLANAVRGCEAVFHVAADYRLWVPDPDEMRRTNVAGTVSLIQHAMRAGVRRIVYTSTVATLGLAADGTPSTEEARVPLDHMIGPYKRSKYLAEQEARRLVAEAGAPVVIVSPTAPFGPRDRKPTPTGRIVIEAASGRMPAYVNTGLNVVHVDDVARGHLLAYERGCIGENYILGGENRSLRWILEQIAELSGGIPPRLRLPVWLVMPLAVVSERMAHIGVVRQPIATVDELRMSQHYMYFSSDKARTSLGHAPRPAREGLRDAVAWFTANGYIHSPNARDAA